MVSANIYHPPICLHEKALRDKAIDPVSGRQDVDSCARQRSRLVDERGEVFQCGPNGMWFEPKPSLLARLLGKVRG